MNDYSDVKINEILEKLSFNKSHRRKKYIRVKNLVFAISVVWFNLFRDLSKVIVNIIDIKWIWTANVNLLIHFFVKLFRERSQRCRGRKVYWLIPLTCRRKHERNENYWFVSLFLHTLQWYVSRGKQSANISNERADDRWKRCFCSERSNKKSAYWKQK